MVRVIDFKKKKKGLRAGCCSFWRGGAGSFAFAAMNVLAGCNIAGFVALSSFPRTVEAAMSKPNSRNKLKRSWTSASGASMGSSSSATTRRSALRMPPSQETMGDDDGAGVDGNDADGEEGEADHDEHQDSNDHSYNTLVEQDDDDDERERVDSGAAFLSEEVRAETLRRRVDTMVLAREPHAVRDIKAFFEEEKNVEAEIAEAERKFSHARFLKEEAQGQGHQRDVPMISSSLVESDRNNVPNFEAEVEFNVATGIFTDLKDMMLGVPPKLLDPMQNPLIDPTKALGEAAPVAAKARLKELVLRAQKTWASTSTALALSTDLWAPPQRVVRQMWLRDGAAEPKGGRASFFTPVRGAAMRAGKGGKGGHQTTPSYSFDPSKDPSGNPTYTAAVPASTWEYGGAKTSTRKRNAGEQMLPQELVHAEYTLYSSTRSLREKGQPVKEDDMRTIAFGMSCDGAIFADKFALVSSDPPDHEEQMDSWGNPVWARPSSTTALSTRAAVEAAMATLIAGDKDTAEVGEETATGSTRTGGPGSRRGFGLRTSGFGLRWGAASGFPPLYQERFSPFTDVEVYPVNPRVFLDELNFKAVAKSQNKEKRFPVFNAGQDEEGGDTPDMLRKAYESVLGSYNADSEDEFESTSRPGGSNGLRAVMNQAFKAVVGLNKPFQSFIKRAWTASDHMPFVSTAKIVLPAAVLEAQTLLPPTATAYVVADPEGSSTADVHFLAARTAAEQANKTRCQDQLRLGAALSAGVPGSASPQLMTEQLSCGSSGAQAHWLQNFNPFSKATTGADEGARTDVGDRQDHYAKAVQNYEMNFSTRTSHSVARPGRTGRPRCPAPPVRSCPAAPSCQSQHYGPDHVQRAASSSRTSLEFLAPPPSGAGRDTRATGTGTGPAGIAQIGFDLFFRPAPGERTPRDLQDYAHALKNYESCLSSTTTRAPDCHENEWSATSGAGQHQDQQEGLRVQDEDDEQEHHAVELQEHRTFKSSQEHDAEHQPQHLPPDGVFDHAPLRVFQWNVLGWGVASMAVPEIEVAVPQKPERGVEVSASCLAGVVSKFCGNFKGAEGAHPPRQAPVKKRYGIQPLFQEAILRQQLKEMNDFLAQNPTGVAAFAFQEDLLKGRQRRAAGAVGDDEGAEADDGYLLKSYEKVEFLEGYWTRLLRGAGFQMAADPGRSYHEGLPARARQFLREHDVTDRAGQQARRIYAGSPAWKSELLDGEEVLMGNSVYVKLGARLVALGCQVSPGGWNGELEEYPHGFGTEVPRRAVGFGTVLCPVLSPAAVEMSAGGGELVWVPIATLGSGHQSGGKFDDALLLDAVLHGGFDHASGEKPQPQVFRGAQVDVDKASPTSCTGRDASDDMDCVEVDHAPSAGPADEEDSEAVPMVQSDSLGQQKHGTWARRASKRLKTADRVGVSDSGHLMLPLIRTEDDSDLYGAGGADLDDAVLSPVRSRNEMHFRGAGTLGRAQVRAFLAEMLEAHAAPAIALFMDFNAKPDMPLLQKVLPQIFPEQYKHELAVLEFDGDDYGNDPRYDDEVHNVFLDQVGDNFVVLSKEASSGALQPPAAPPAK